MQSQHELLYDADGNPFHMAGTRIYCDTDGTLYYICPHCREHPVPTRHITAFKDRALPCPEGEKHAQFPAVRTGMLGDSRSCAT